MHTILIDKMEWIDGNLKIKYYSKTESDIILYSKKLKEAHHINSIEEAGLKSSVITFFDKDSKFIFKKGRWRAVFGEELIPAQLSDEIMLNIEDYTRCFYNDDFTKAVVISPIIINYTEENIQGIAFEVSYIHSININGYKRNFITAKREATSFKSFMHKCFFITAKWILNVFYKFVASIHNKTGKNILIMSENRNGIMDNLEAIDTRIKERGLDKEFKITYHFRNIFAGRQNPFSWLRTICLIAKQDFIFVDDYAPIFAFLDLDKRTTLVQVWHAGFGFKLVGYGRFGINGSPHPIKSCHRKYTYALIGNDYLREIYSEVFGIEKEALLATGMPRLEHFLDESHKNTIIAEFYETFPELKGKKIITFAPTYRGSNQRNAYYDFSKLNFDRLYEYCKSSNSVFIIKQHHFLREKAPITPEQSDIFYECSDYKLNDLFYVTDILITDYSSCFYDFLLLGRPVLFFTYDRAVYSATRGVHRPISKVAPGTICDNFDQLLDALKNENYGSIDAVNFLKDKCTTNKMLASDKVIDYILLHKEVEDI
ncbi:MAG: teichoic acid biosynthesis protein [Firmicutes bacterium]|jgi:CDP-ribitol ribitolphosphotransferase|nr:teichoic acid biosynthesis protein [Bacillota bacterium]